MSAPGEGGARCGRGGAGARRCGEACRAFSLECVWPEAVSTGLYSSQVKRRSWPMSWVNLPRKEKALSIGEKDL